MKSEDVCVSLLLLKQSGIAPGFCLLGLPMRCQVGVRERYDGYYSFERDVEPVTVQFMPMQLNEPLKVPAPAFTVMSRLVIVRLSIGTSALVGTMTSAVM